MISCVASPPPKPANPVGLLAVYGAAVVKRDKLFGRQALNELAEIGYRVSDKIPWAMRSQVTQATLESMSKLAYGVVDHRPDWQKEAIAELRRHGFGVEVQPIAVNLTIATGERPEERPEPSVVTGLKKLGWTGIAPSVFAYRK